VKREKVSVGIFEVRDVVRAVDRVRFGEKRDAAIAERVVRSADGRDGEDDFDRLGSRRRTSASELRAEHDRRGVALLDEGRRRRVDRVERMLSTLDAAELAACARALALVAKVLDR
jgi:hypothetical protein